MLEDEARSSATFRFTVPQFSTLKDRISSPPFYVRNLPWKIEVMPRLLQGEKNLGFFLRCNDQSISTWSCYAVAELRLLSVHPDVGPLTMVLPYLFDSKHNNRGYTKFILWSDVLDPDKGFIQNDTVTLEVQIYADAPQGLSWDNKKHIGFIGLKDHRTTCYVKSLLTILFYTKELRSAIYKIPTKLADSSNSIALRLQRVFYKLQSCDTFYGFKKMTTYFDLFPKPNAQECLNVLLDTLENEMKGTCVEGAASKLFQGRTLSYIRYKNADFSLAGSETFYSIQLKTEGIKNIYESFEDYIATETLDGQHEDGFKEAEKQVIFSAFPPVLHLHLIRSQSDPTERYEFYEKISLDPYLRRTDPNSPANYTLHAVLVHTHSGSYVVFVNRKGDGNWCKFDDDVCSLCTKQKAIEHNYGGHDSNVNMTGKHCTEPCMLVYVRDSKLLQVFEQSLAIELFDYEEKTVGFSVSSVDIPRELSDRFNEEERIERVRRQERNEENIYMTVNVLLEDAFEDHQSNDLFDPERVVYRVFDIARSATVAELIDMLSDHFERPSGEITLWPFSHRANEAFRPTLLYLDTDLHKTVNDASNEQNPWNIFVEFRSTLLEFDKRVDVLLFFKLYIPKQKKLRYCGHHSLPRSSTFSDLVRLLNERAGFPPDTELILYEEKKPNVVEKITPLEKVVDLLMDGDIIIFEKDEPEELFDLPTCIDYFEDLFHMVEVTFVDLYAPNESAFTMELSPRITYDHLARAVARRLNIDPSFLQFSKRQKFKDSPGNRIRCTFDGTLKDMLVLTEVPKKLFYQQLSVNVYELENKYRFKCMFVGPRFKEGKELVLYPNKGGTVADLLEKARKFVKNDNTKLRLVQINSNHLEQVLKEDTPLRTLTVTYRIEELPFDPVEQLEKNEKREVEDLEVLQRQVEELTIANDKLQKSNMKIAAELENANIDLETERQKVSKLVKTLKNRLDEAEKEINRGKVKKTIAERKYYQFGYRYLNGNFL